MKINDGYRRKSGKMPKPIAFTPEKLMEFERAIDLADGDTFTFEGRLFVKAFAVYAAKFVRQEIGMEPRGDV